MTHYSDTAPQLETPVVELACPAAADEMVQRLRRDVESLVSIDRRTAQWGERTSATYIVQRLADIGAEDIRLPTFSTQTSWVPAHLVYLALGVGVAAQKHPLARLAGAATTIAYELEVSGRITWAKRLLPAHLGTSVCAGLPASGQTERVLVLVAHHDAAHTGVVWHEHAVAASRQLAKLSGRSLPSHMVPLGALSATAIPSGRVRAIATAVLAGIATLMVQAMHSRTAPGANDNASGVAAALEIARRLVRTPLPGTTVFLVFPGAEEATNGGIRDWLRRTGRQLDPDSTLVINLDAVGSNGPVAVATREALTNRSAPGAVERARRAAAELNLPIETIAIPNATDAAVTTLAGLPTVSLLSVEDGWISNLHRPSDTMAGVNWTTVRHTVELTIQIARSWATEQRTGRNG